MRIILQSFRRRPESRLLGHELDPGLRRDDGEFETNGCDYARFVVAAVLRAGKPLKLTPEGIKAITTADYPLPAKRPANSRLDTTRFKQTFGLELPHWQLGLQHILDQIL